MDESQDWATVEPIRAKSIGRRGNMVIQGERGGGCASSKDGEARIKEREECGVEGSTKVRHLLKTIELNIC